MTAPALPPIRRGEPSRIVLTGKHSYGLDNIELKSWGEGAHLFVGSFCSIAGQQTVFLGGNHRTECATTFPFGHALQELFPAGAEHAAEHPRTNGHVVIEHDVWIGRGCTIMSGLTIGSGSVIAAGSVVVKTIAPYTIVGGNPAQPIRQRFPDPIIEALLELQWWHRSDAEINRIVPLLQQPLDLAVLSQIKAVLQGGESQSNNNPGSL
jgi:acetyltransferase-like isoleucine patch superfamily enzyme